MAKGRKSVSNRRPAAWQYDWKVILNAAKEFVEANETSVTLRQLYYYLVSRELIPNNQNFYKRLSSKTAAARREGWFPSLIDRTRAIEAHQTWVSPQSSLEMTLDSYRRDRTEGQDWSIYLGVEKHGMSVQLMHWFGNLGIPVLALGGYSSQTFVDVVKDDILRQGRKAVLLYAGDFDPTGIDIDRDFEERTEIFDKMVRVALTKPQVEKYDLPPLPGKETDVRKWSFIAKHGELIQVELDALPPTELRKLYQQAINRYWKKKPYELSVAREEEERAVLRDAFKLSTLDNPVSKSIFLLKDGKSPVALEPSSGQISVLMDAVHDLDAA